jgi:hypothetical protein
MPTASSGASPPHLGNLSFHVVVDYANRSFSMDGPDCPSGVWLHYQVVQVARGMKNKFWEFDIRAETQEQALAQVQADLYDYKFTGTWAATTALSAPSRSR